jgi:hypothetical protein
MILHLFSLTVEIYFDKRSKNAPVKTDYEHVAREKTAQVLTDVLVRRS